MRRRLGVIVVLFAAALSGCGSGVRAPSPARSVRTRTEHAGRRGRVADRAERTRIRRPHAPFAVGLRVVTFVDRSREIRLAGRAPKARTLETLIRYPAVGPPARTDIAGAAPERGARPFPLVVFGHGYAVTPAIYARLLQAWTRAGYVVAAPVFPLENARAPGGPDEADLVNQPRDMSFVITELLRLSRERGDPLSGIIDPGRIAVSGQSDGGETALAVAYDTQFLDRRVRAAVILSGAEIPHVGGFDFPAPSPPLLAIQGTADPINPPALTHAFFEIAPEPKYLLTLAGGSHLGPYTDQQPQLGTVERVTIAFFDRYLKGIQAAARRIVAAGKAPGASLASTG